MRVKEAKKAIGPAVVSLAMFAAIAATASAGASHHTYSVKLTIEADGAKHVLSGAILSKAPSEFCEEAKIRVREVMPGKDEVVAKLKPRAGGTWSLKTPKKLRGHRVYTETSRYQLPSRPVTCLAGRSPKIVAR